MTKTQFPWREYGFSSARDMLLSMENIVEFKFLDEENQFYLLPAAHVTRNSIDNSRNSGTWSRQSKSVASTERINSSRVLHNSINSCQSTASSDSNADKRMPSLVETTGQGNGMFTFDHHGRVSVYVSQSKEKPAQGYWNVCIYVLCLALAKEITVYVVFLNDFIYKNFENLQHFLKIKVCNLRTLCTL